MILIFSKSADQFLSNKIKDITKSTLIVLLIDGDNNHIVNANCVTLKQVRDWRERHKPEYIGEEKPLGTTATVETYYFDEEKGRMPYPVKIKNPLIEETEVEVSLEVEQLADNATIQ